MKKARFLLFLGIIFLISFSWPTWFAGGQEGSVCAVYFTGIGCPHCAKVDPVLLGKVAKEYPNIAIIEYEVYQSRENAPLILEYNENYNSGMGIPLIILNQNGHFSGDRPILENINKITGLEENLCPLIDGSSASFGSLDINALPGKPKIWMNDRILIKVTGGGNSEQLKNLLSSEDISSAVKEISYKVVDPKPVFLSGGSVLFDNAIQLSGWMFEWNGEKIAESQTEENNSSVPLGTPAEAKRLTLGKILTLAVADSVNPCALAVLTLILISILTCNPGKKRKVLLAGLAFAGSVFIMYFLYGLVIVRFFQIIQALTAIRLWLYKALGILAVILGVLNIKDFIRYKPGGLATEMPLFLRPKAKKVIEKATSPQGAFVIGLFVTLFLLPCTIGPYVIAGGILSALALVKAIPFLLFYNLIFILPMIVITLIVYAGFAKAGDVSEWKEKNIRYLHLLAGLIIFGLGLAMVFGWV